MRHLTQPNRWTCLPTAFAMVLGRSLEEVLDGIGHDGSEVIWPDLAEPKRRRSFHIQELIDYAWSQGYAVTQFQARPVLAPDAQTVPFVVHYLESRVRGILDGRRAVLTGVASRGSRHAVAWDGKFILDPNGSVYALDEFTLDSIWVAVNVSGGNLK